MTHRLIYIINYHADGYNSLNRNIGNRASGEYGYAPLSSCKSSQLFKCKLL